MPDYVAAPASPAPIASASSFALARDGKDAEKRKAADDADESTRTPASAAEAPAFGAVGGYLGNAAVTPVALPMPTAERWVSISRELVTRERPMRPVVWYVTDVTVAIVEGLWLACALGLAWSKRDELRAMRDRARAWLNAPPAATPTPEATPTPAE
jgi:hypothetical protein